MVLGSLLSLLVTVFAVPHCPSFSSFQGAAPLITPTGVATPATPKGGLQLSCKINTVFINAFFYQLSSQKQTYIELILFYLYYYYGFCIWISFIYVSFCLFLV